MRSIEIIPTNTCPPDVEELARRSSAFASFAPDVQLDISDGIFSTVTSWPYGEGQYEALKAMAERGEKLPESDRISYEVHLMVQEPREIGTLLVRLGAKRIIGHVEVFDTAERAHETLAAWRKAGALEVGLAILMDTPLEVLEHHILIVDTVLMMSIASIGKQGIPYEERAPGRIAEFHARHPDILISVDGDISEKNIAELARAGASRFAVGSAISKATDPKQAYKSLKSLAENALQ